MPDKIIKGVAAALAGAFGETCAIYQNDVEQGLQTPCFFLAPLQVGLMPIRGERDRLRVPLDVRYHPARYGDNRALLDMGAGLYDLLGVITLPGGDTLRGTDRHFETEDGVLHFFVTYTIHLVRPRAQTPMEELETQVGTTQDNN